MNSIRKPASGKCLLIRLIILFGTRSDLPFLVFVFLRQKLHFYSFKQRSNENDYVIIDPVNYPLSCHSTIGKKGGPQKVRCGNCKIDGVFHYGRILHELFHVVGKILIFHYQLLIMSSLDPF